jgi:flagella synthesis protein FlgN
METTAQLLSCLLDEDATILEFTALLEDETNALTDRHSFETLQAITERKNEFAVRLSELSNRRDSLLAELGLPAAHQGTGMAAEQHAELAQPWKTLLEHSAAAAGINERNGTLIDMHLRYTEEALGALRSLTASTSLYDSTGGRSRHPAGSAKSIVAT